MRIAIFGNFGVNNLGDDLILMGLIEQWKGHELMVFCGKPEMIKPQFGLDAQPFFPGGVRSLAKLLSSANYRKELRIADKVLRSCSLIIIGGGGILVDRRMATIAVWKAQLRKISQSGRPYQFLGNSFELGRWWSRGIFKRYLQQAEKITVRDTASLEFIQSMGLKVELVDDFAITVIASAAKQSLDSFNVLKIASVPRNDMRRICLALCKSGVGTHELSVLRKFISHLKSEGYEIVALAFQTVGDDDRELYKKIDPTLKVVHGLENILDQLTSCRLLVGMRFHSILLALHFGIPVIALAYQEKVSNLMTDRGLSGICIPLHNLDEQKLQELFTNAIEASDESDMLEG